MVFASCASVETTVLVSVRSVLLSWVDTLVSKEVSLVLAFAVVPAVVKVLPEGVDVCVVSEVVAVVSSVITLVIGVTVVTDVKAWLMMVDSVSDVVFVVVSVTPVLAVCSDDVGSFVV